MTVALKRTNKVREHFNSPFWHAVRVAARRRYDDGYRPPLLTENPKTLKGLKKSYSTSILHMAPSLSSGYTMCGNESLGCATACLNTSGRGMIEMYTDGERHRVHVARVTRAIWFNEGRDGFLKQLVREIAHSIMLAESKHLVPTFRLNGTSDILWERLSVNIDNDLSSLIKRKTGRSVNPGTHLNVMGVFHWVQFYDYTKVVNRPAVPSNYDLTFSRSENNNAASLRALSEGKRVAVVFRVGKKEPFPAQWNGYAVIDGDDTDLRFLDPSPCIVGLSQKGRSFTDTTGFIVNPERII